MMTQSLMLAKKPHVVVGRSSSFHPSVPFSNWMVAIPFQPPQAGWLTTLRTPRDSISGRCGILLWMKQIEY